MYHLYQQKYLCISKQYRYHILLHIQKKNLALLKIRRFNFYFEYYDINMAINIDIIKYYAIKKISNQIIKKIIKKYYQKNYDIFSKYFCKYIEFFSIIHNDT